LLTSAIVSALEIQLTCLLRSSVVPSLNVPVAASCTVVSLAIEGPGGVSVIEVNVAAVTVTVVEPWMPPRVAVIGVLPGLTPVTSPMVLEVLLTCAIELLPELQLT
jgi:hypothetical protein